jgi:hypothetical protein
MQVSRSALAHAHRLVVLCLLEAGCGGNSPSTPTMTTPTTPVVPPVQIAGIWSGSASDSSGAGKMTWTLTQNNASVTGDAQVETALKTVIMTGKISGTVSVSTFEWRLDIPAGGVSVQAGCTVTVTGSSTIAAGAASMTGSYSGTGSCTPPFSNGTVTLNKQ